MRFDWRAAAWLATGFAIGMIAVAISYANARTEEAQERTVQICIEHGGHPYYDEYARFAGCK